jgi:hypothetical protein
MAEAQRLVTLLLTNNSRPLERHLEKELSEGWTITAVTPLGTAVRPFYTIPNEHEGGLPLACCWVAVTLAKR